jgi:hypothetical protein
LRYDIYMCIYICIYMCVCVWLGVKGSILKEYFHVCSKLGTQFMCHRTVSARYFRLAFRGKHPKEIRRSVPLEIPELQRRRYLRPASGY